MKKITLGAALMLLAACALLAVAATAGTGVVQNTNSGKTETGTSANANAKAVNANANRGAAKMSSDEKFAMGAAMGGLEEVELGRVAAQKGASDEVRQFGQRMVDDHSKANQDLTQVASAKGWVLPTALDAKHQADVQKLSALTGDKFDKEYVDMMLKDHKKDVPEFQKESAGGADADIKSFAARTTPTLQEHLQMIQRIHDKMALRKSGNLKTTNSNSGGGMDNTNSGGNTNSNAGNSNSNRGKSKGNKNTNSNTGSNSNM
jgi:putative membrane protein